ncbi:MAG: hypothetical protein WC869_11145 [Phycisphaerae bacterium]|jgi:hypothetical protein
MIDWKIKEMFFDSKAVTSAVDAGVRRVLSKFGAFVRQAARSSIRRRKAASQPGSPPSGHVGTLKRLIFFGYDTANRSVVIGPAPFRSVVEAPPLLEYGGTASRKDRRGRSRRVTYKARPFMAPALQKELPKLLPMWGNSVRK